MPPIGKLRHRIQLQSAVETRDARNQPRRTWTTYATVWAQVVPATSEEGPLGVNQQQAAITHRITIRYRSGVTSEHRAIWNTYTLNFKAPPRDLEGRGIWLEIDAEEGK